MKVWITQTLLACVALLAPIHALLIATGVIVAIDLITGIWRAIKSKETITSSMLRRTVTKVFVYQIAIITGFILETYLLAGIPVTKLVSSVIGLVEIKSILENLDDIYGGDLFKALLAKLGSDNANKPDSDPKAK